MGDEKSAYFYLFLTILLWPAVPAVAKLVLGELSNLQMLFYTNLIGSVTLLGIVVFQNKLGHFSEYKKADYLKMAGMGFLGIYLYYILLFGSFSLAPAGQANMINYLWPTFVVVFSIILLREKFNYKTVLAILTSFLGALIVFTRADLSNFNSEYSIGYLLAFFAAMAYGLFSVLGKRLPYEKFTSMVVYYISSLTLISLTILMFSNFVVPTRITTILGLLFLGGLANSLGFVFWFKALSLGQTHKIANIIYINPFLSLIFVYLINNETIPAISILGLVLIVGGILMQMKNK